MIDNFLDGIEHLGLKAQLKFEENKRRARIYGVVLAIPTLLFLATTALGLLWVPIGGPTAAMWFLATDIVWAAIIIAVFAPGIGVVDALQELPFLQRFKEEIKSMMIIGNVAMFLGILMTPLAFATLVDTTRRSALSFWIIVAFFYFFMFLGHLGFTNAKSAPAKK